MFIALSSKYLQEIPWKKKVFNSFQYVCHSKKSIDKACLDNIGYRWLTPIFNFHAIFSFLVASSLSLTGSCDGYKMLECLRWKLGLWVTEMLLASCALLAEERAGPDLLPSHGAFLEAATTTFPAIEPGSLLSWRKMCSSISPHDLHLIRVIVGIAEGVVVYSVCLARSLFNLKCMCPV